MKTTMQTTATVSVYKPCDCAVCAAGGRWFNCLREGANLVAQYDCQGIEDGPYPTRASLEFIRSAHPGMSLVHL